MALYKAVFLVFLVLKLAAVGVVAEWPWWVVTAPLWCVLITKPATKRK